MMLAIVAWALWMGYPTRETTFYVNLIFCVPAIAHFIVQLVVSAILYSRRLFSHEYIFLDMVILFIQSPFVTIHASCLLCERVRRLLYESYRHGDNVAGSVRLYSLSLFFILRPSCVDPKTR